MADIIGRIITPELDLKHIPPAVSISVAYHQPTERPIEDRYSVHFSPDQNRLIIGVYDGHGGSETSTYVSTTLPELLLSHPPTSHAQVFVELDNSILEDFKRDHSLFRSKHPDWRRHAELIKAGSTALILDINIFDLVAHLANAGDCRLVLFDPISQVGEIGSDNPPYWETVDLNAKTASEKERLYHEHPNEAQIIVGNRLFGRLMSTRGFGDGYYKLPKGVFGDGKHRAFIKTLSSIERPGKVPMIEQYASLFFAYSTPPYITARPETGEYQMKHGSVGIIATDGLWDLVSTEEAVGIVCRGVAEGAKDLAEYLLRNVKAKQAPGDDITIVILQI